MTQNNVPKLRFKEFSGEWEPNKFGELFSFKVTNSFSRDNLNYSGGSVKNIHYGDIHTKFKTHFDITVEYVPFVNSDISLERINPDCYCQEGDVIIADASEDYKDIGKSIELINLNNQKLLSGLHTFLARPRLNVLGKGFISYAMQYEKVRLQIMTIAQGTKVLSISSGRLANVQISIPSLPEQTKIASFLSSVDNKLTLLTAKKDALIQYKKGVMQQIFNQEVRFKDEDGSDYPDWEEKALGEIAIRSISKNKNSIISLVFTNSATDGIVNQRDYFEKDIANQNNLEGYYIVELDDFVYNPRISNFAPVGPIKRNHIGRGVMSPLYTIFRFNKGNLSFFEYFFETTGWHDYMASIANFGARHDRMNITNANFIELPLPFPSLPEQTKIASFLTSLDDKINAMDQQIEKVKDWKKGLLQGMFV